MYRVIPIKGEAFVVNDAHLLSLVHTESDVIIDDPISEYLTWPKNRKREHKLFRTQLNFPSIPALPLRPYFLGVFLGDGSSRSGNGGLEISKPDSEILSAVTDEALEHGQFVRTEHSLNRCPAYHLTNRWRPEAPIKSAIKMLGLFGLTSAQRFIPQLYKTASLSDRLELLAGLLDTDGCCSRNGHDEISASRQLALDLCYVARSVGLAAYAHQEETTRKGK